MPHGLQPPFRPSPADDQILFCGNDESSDESNAAPAASDLELRTEAAMSSSGFILTCQNELSKQFLPEGIIC